MIQHIFDKRLIDHQQDYIGFFLFHYLFVQHIIPALENLHRTAEDFRGLGL